ncbi:hypothetical protein MPSEU_000752000 [Mayamaea pseudoterrestris]|nr:hypothetical protein MPSEU_000752000 [Mayamaea pseudoterrestris]
MQENNGNPHHDDDDDAAAKALTIVDRFLSASSGPDAQLALEQLVEGLEQGRILLWNVLQLQPSKSISKSNSSSTLTADSILLLEKLLQVLTTATFDNFHLDEGPSLVARFYTIALDSKYATRSNSNSNISLAELQKLLLTEPNEQLVSALVQVSVDATKSDYARVLCLQLLHSLSESKSTKRTMTNLLIGSEATLLAQLLCGNVNDDDASNNASTTSMAVYQEAMRLALLLSTWPAVAKNWIFMNVVDQVLLFQLSLQDDEDSHMHLTNGPSALGDWLQLIQNLLEACDANLVPLLVLESPVLPAKLTELLDLRMGQRFRFPNSRFDEGGASSTVSKRVAAASDSSKVDDDLDNLLQAGSKATKSTSVKTLSMSKPQIDAQQSAGKDTTLAVPYLTVAEESIVQAVLNIIATMLEHETIRQALLASNSSSNKNKYETLVNFLWLLGLFIRPSPVSSDDNTADVYTCAVPSLALQQQALQVLAKYFCVPNTNQDDAASHAQRLDRILYLVCTGGSAGEDSGAQQHFREQLGLSQSALHCFRKSLSAEQCNELLLYSLAPPPLPLDDDNNNEADDMQIESTQAVQTSIVARLLNTVFEQLLIVMEAANTTPSLSEATPSISSRCQVLLSGATGALMVLLTNEASRTMLLRLTQEPSLMDQILEGLTMLGGIKTNDETSSECGVEFCLIVLLRFLAHWVFGSPEVVHKLLQSPSSSLAVSTLISSRRTNVSTLTTLLLGLILNDMVRIQNSGDGEFPSGVRSGVESKSIDESQCGGWTRASVMELLTAQGISRVTGRLEHFKTINEVLPWSLCALEWHVWKDWYTDAVLVVRKRVIHELTAGSSDASGVVGDGRDDVDDATTCGDSKSLQGLVSQQARDMDLLQQQLSEIRNTVAFQDQQMIEWKKRLDSNPTQLDEMLNDYSTKISDLERKNANLEEDLRRRDVTIETVQKQLIDSQLRCDESRQETESLRDELTALSHAYSNLESEYQQQMSRPIGPAAATAAGSMSGEQDDAPRQQAQGEVSQQSPSSAASPSTEVAMLRADNARLRQDAQAADEWMAMAVERMNEMGSQNAGLAQQVENLQDQLDSANTTEDVAFREEMQTLLDGERGLKLELEKKYLEQIAALGKSLQKEQTIRQELEVVALNAEQLSGQLEAERLHAKELQQQLELIQQAQHGVNSEYIDQSNLVEQLQKELQDARCEISRLLEVRQLSTDEGESSVARDSLADNLERVKKEFAVAGARDQEELYKCEARIRELEARLDGGLGKYTMDDIRQRDHDIAELQKANNEAQEWMANAVEQHQLLTNQVNSLAQKNNSLNARIHELSVRNTDATASSSDEYVAKELKLKLDALRQDIASKEETIEQLRVGLEVSANAEKERLAQFEDQVECLQQKLKEQEKAAIDVIKQWSESYAAIEAERNALLSRLPSDSDSAVELEKRLKSLEQQRLEEEQAAIVAVKGWEESYRALEASNNELLVRLEFLERENESSKNVITSVETADSRRCSQLDADISDLRLQLANQEKAAMETIAGWQESYTALEADRNEVVGQLEALKHEKEDSLKINSFDETRVNEITERLKEQSDEAQEAIAGWQERYSELKAANNELQSQLDTLTENHRKVADVKRDCAEARDALSEARLSAARELDEVHAKLIETQETNADLVCELTEGKATISRLQTDLSDLRKGLAEKEVLLAELTIERNELQERLEAVRIATDEKSAVAVVDESTVDLDHLRERMERLEKDKLGLESELAMASDVVSQWEASYIAMENEKNEFESRLDAISSAKSLAIQSEDEGETSAMEIADLKSKIAYLEQQHAQEESDAQATVNEWQEAHQDLESRQDVLQTRLDTVTVELSLLHEKHATTDAELVEVRAALQVALIDKAGLESLISKRNAMLEALEDERNNLLARLSALTLSSGATGQENGDDWKKGHIQNREEELESELAIATDAVAQWESSYNVVEADRSDLEARLAAVTAADSKLLNVDGILAHEDSAQIVTKLEARAKELEDELARETGDAQTAIAEWQEGYNALELEKNNLQSRFDDAKAELERVIQSRDGVHSRMDKLLEDVAGTSHANNDGLCLDDLRGRLQELAEKNRQLESELATATDVVSQWEASYTSMETEKAELESRLELYEGMKDKTSQPLDERHEASIAELNARITVLESDKVDLQVKLTDVDDQINHVRVSLSVAEKQNEELVDLTAEKESKIKILESKLSEVNKSLTDKDKIVVQLQTDNDHLQTRLSALIYEIKEATANNDVSSEIEDLQRQIKRLEIEKVAISDDLAVAGDVVSQWATSFNDLEAEKNELKARIHDFQALKDAAAGELENEAETAITQWENLCSELETEKSDLQARLNTMDNESQAARRRLLELENKYEIINAELQEARSQNDAMRTQQARLAETESLLSEATTIARQRDSENKTLIDALSAKCGEYDVVSLKLDESEEVVGSLRVEVASLKTTVDDKEAAVLVAQKHIQELQNDHHVVYDALQQSRKSYDELAARLEASEAAATSMHEEVSRLRTCADDAAANLELKKRIQELENDHYVVHAELQNSRRSCDELAARLQASESAAASLREEVGRLRNNQKRIKELENDHHVVYHELQHSRNLCDEVTARLHASESVASMLRAENDRLQTSVKDQAAKTERIQELQNDHRVVHSQLQEARRTCDEFAARLEAFNSIAEKMGDENDRLREIHNGNDAETEELYKLRDELAKSKEIIDRLDSDNRKLCVEFETFKLEAESTIAQWKATLEEAQVELASTSNNAELAIDQWESRCRELDTRIFELTSQLELLQATASTASSTAALDSEIERLRNDNANLLTEQQRLVGLIHERENDVKEATAAVEFQITNSVSERATALASEALRKHVDELRSSLQVTQQEYLDAHDARLAAEDEAELLREDLAALLGMKNTPETQGEVRRQALNLKVEFRRKERMELIELKDSLANALDRLEASHEEQLAAEERISKTSLQATIYEQELVSTKGDLNMLVETLDEMRQAESTQREAMEYRISELRNEYQVLQKQKLLQVGALQNELSQITMERDRLMKALKESERHKDSFFQSTIGRESMASGSPTSLQTELAKLRLEKAHLLNSLSEEAANVERRVRDARAVSKSVAEAEVIIEREMRMSAEKALDELRSEMIASRHANGDDANHHARDIDFEHMEALRQEIQALHEQNMSLAQDITRLEDQLHSSQESARNEKRKLTEELKTAMTRNVQLEREGRREAEFCSELARLGQHENVNKRRADNPASDDENENDNQDVKRDEALRQIKQYYDETQRLNERLAHDRAVYLELLSQHDDLLAVLAQENAMRKCIEAALEKVGGKPALEQALMEASSGSMAEHGEKKESES